MALGAPMLRGPLRRPCTTPALTRVPRRGCGRSRNLEFRVSHRVRNLISANSEVYHGAILTIRTSIRAFEEFVSALAFGSDTHRRGDLRGRVTPNILHAHAFAQLGSRLSPSSNKAWRPIYAAPRLLSSESGIPK